MNLHQLKPTGLWNPPPPPFVYTCNHDTIVGHLAPSSPLGCRKKQNKSNLALCFTSASVLIAASNKWGISLRWVLITYPPLVLLAGGCNWSGSQSWRNNFVVAVDERRSDRCQLESTGRGIRRQPIWCWMWNTCVCVCVCKWQCARASNRPLMFVRLYEKTVNTPLCVILFGGGGGADKTQTGLRARDPLPTPSPTPPPWQKNSSDSTPSER